jgi:predicted AAA+ superfamily ATPase
MKIPKLYFFDSGLVANLMGIEHPDQLAHHPLRGGIFEGWVASEVLKAHFHQGRRPRLFFYRERGRLEIDFLLEQGTELIALEVKAARTPSSSFFGAFRMLEQRLAERGDTRWRLSRRIVVYGGEESQRRSAGELVAWADIPHLGFVDHMG